MKYKNLSFVLLLLASEFIQAQSKTTEALHQKHSEALSLFFYNSTLRMLNQKDDAEFDELIKDIEKMRFLMISKDNRSLDYKKLVKDYQSESFEAVMTSRHEGKNFDVYLKEKNGHANGMIVLINDSTNLYVLDILGSIALSKIGKLYNAIDDNADIAKKIEAFTGRGDGSNKKDHSGH